ncbi:MAG: hypothetical protein EA387_02555 [Nitriliruptor sp.]|nr:MAG: hypothetical protein EA387_02555 [Nitriliruptor sp.]
MLSLGLARAGAEVLAVEGDAAAVAAARRNAELNGLPLDARDEAVGSLLRRAVRTSTGVGGTGDGSGAGAGADADTGAGARPLDPPDVVVLDPPRTGAGEQVIADLVALQPAAIVYVACDVAALARDTRHLAVGGYRLRRAAPLDLFPMTHHVEVVATFSP